MDGDLGFDERIEGFAVHAQTSGVVPGPGFFQTDPRQALGLTVFIRIVGIEAVDVGPSFEDGGAERGGQQRGGIVAAAPAQRGGPR